MQDTLAVCLRGNCKRTQPHPPVLCKAPITSLYRSGILTSGLFQIQRQHSARAEHRGAGSKPRGTCSKVGNLTVSERCNCSFLLREERPRAGRRQGARGKQARTQEHKHTPACIVSQSRWARTAHRACPGLRLQLRLATATCNCQPPDATWALAPAATAPASAETAATCTTTASSWPDVSRASFSCPVASPPRRSPSQSHPVAIAPHGHLIAWPSQQPTRLLIVAFTSKTDRNSATADVLLVTKGTRTWTQARPSPRARIQPFAEARIPLEQDPGPFQSHLASICLPT